MVDKPARVDGVEKSWLLRVALIVVDPAAGVQQILPARAMRKRRD